jgi:hypothetical protein
VDVVPETTVAQPRVLAAGLHHSLIARILHAGTNLTVVKVGYFTVDIRQFLKIEM